MKDEQLIEQVSFQVELALKDNESGHDWFHIQRVYNNAIYIAKLEQGCNLLVVQLLALLHDIADSKFHNGDETVGPKKARELLEELQVEQSVIDHVVLGIENISFKGGNVNKTFTSKELDIVQDADRLDAIGAIGIARAFNYGGYKNNTIHDPSEEPMLNMSKEQYKKHKGTTINHFYEKLFRLKDLMNTQTGKQLAEQRHQYMENFISQFYYEWELK
ncbi:HD domain-containing protein [Myroides sp. LJL116]